jgi:hypothetical protein
MQAACAAKNFPCQGGRLVLNKVKNEYKNGVPSESWYSEIADRFRPGELRVPSQWTLALSKC